MAARHRPAAWPRPRRSVTHSSGAAGASRRCRARRRALDVRLAGEGGGDVRGEEGHRDQRHESFGVRTHGVDVGGDGHLGGVRQPGRAQGAASSTTSTCSRRVFVSTSGRSASGGRARRGSRCQQDDAFARAFVHQDHGIPVGRVGHQRVRRGPRHAGPRRRARSGHLRPIRTHPRTTPSSPIAAQVHSVVTTGRRPACRASGSRASRRARRARDGEGRRYT